MANITELTEVTAVAGTDVLYCVQGSNDRKFTASQLATYLSDTMDSLEINSNFNTYGEELLVLPYNLPTGWDGSLPPGEFTHNVGNTNNLTHDATIVSSTKYRLVYTISGRTAGTITIAFGGLSTGAISVSGTLHGKTTSTSAFNVAPSSDFNGTCTFSLKTLSLPIYVINIDEQLRLGYDSNNYASFTVSSAGVLTLTTSANKIALGASRTPASATDTGTAGEVCWDANYVYVCVAANTWRRAALSSW